MTARDKAFAHGPVKSIRAKLTIRKWTHDSTEKFADVFDSFRSVRRDCNDHRCRSKRIGDALCLTYGFNPPLHRLYIFTHDNLLFLLCDGGHSVPPMTSMTTKLTIRERK